MSVECSALGVGSSPRGAVFLSYASQDAEAAKRICETLRTAGVEVWFDQSELVGGDAWDQKIRKQIGSCTLFVPIISAATQSRREAYFRLEWKIADERTHLMAKGTPFILPVTIDETNDRGALVPDSFLAVQWTRAPGCETLPAFAQRVKNLLTGGSGTVAASAPVSSGATQRRNDSFWVAVLPFRYRGTDGDVADLAAGMTEEIVTGLSRFSYLRVIGNSSTSRYARESVDVRMAGRDLGARYVMEGSLRQAGSRLRIAVQVVDATNGAHLWAENYDRAYSADTVFELQDELVPQIVATIADQQGGVLVHSISEELRRLDPGQLTPYEALLRGFGYYERISPVEHAEVRAILERAVAQAPEHGECWSMLTFLYADEFNAGYNPRPDSLGRAVAAARRAVELAPNNELSYYALANALFFSREFDAFRVAAERALSFNVGHATSIAYMGLLLAYAGEWERGCALAQRAARLNPHHPGWFMFGDCFNSYRQRDYQSALAAALKINMPAYYWYQVARAATFAQLGQLDLAAKSLRELLSLRPDFAGIARSEIGKWLGSDPEIVEHFIDGLRKAGLSGVDFIKP